MHQQFFKFGGKVRYGRSPVVLTEGVEYPSLEMPTSDSILVTKGHFGIASGKKWFDLLEFESSTHFVISDRFHQALVEAEITGWSDYKVEIEGSEDRQ